MGLLVEKTLHWIESMDAMPIIMRFTDYLLFNYACFVIMPKNNADRNMGVAK